MTLSEIKDPDASAVNSRIEREKELRRTINTKCHILSRLYLTRPRLTAVLVIDFRTHSIIKKCLMPMEI